MSSSIPTQVTAVRNAYNSGKSRSYEWRIGQLKAIRKMLEEQEQAIFDALKQDLNKAEQETYATEVAVLISEIKHSIKHLKKWMKPRKVSTPLPAQPGKSYILPEPLGVVLVMGAWNYPLQLTLSPALAAITAGNAVVMKPSELSPATSAVMAKYLPQYVDSELITVIEGALQESTDLLEQRWDHIFYTGGGHVGKIVMAAAAKNLTPVTLELGGKSPCIIDSDVDINLTAKRIGWGKWLNAGQTCVAPDYILTTPAMVEPLTKAFKAVLKDFFGDNPEQSDSYGRIVNERHHQRLINYLNDGEVVIGGAHNVDSCYIEPTVMTVSNTDSAILQEEIFGPLLPIVTVDNLDAAIEFTNRREKPLALYVFSRSGKVQDRVQRETTAGNMCINDTIMFMTVPDLSFGGVGSSGMGGYHGEHGFKTFSHFKSVLKRANFGEIPVRYAPYSKTKLGLLRRLL